MTDITQADREAAAAYLKRVGSNRWSQNGILSGECDNFSVTLAFAAHRNASIHSEREEAKVLVEALRVAVEELDYFIGVIDAGKKAIAEWEADNG